jgi:hypothetical protein
MMEMGLCAIPEIDRPAFKSKVINKNRSTNRVKDLIDIKMI